MSEKNKAQLDLTSPPDDGDELYSPPSRQEGEETGIAQKVNFSGGKSLEGLDNTSLNTTHIPTNKLLSEATDPITPLQDKMLKSVTQTQVMSSGADLKPVIEHDSSYLLDTKKFEHMQRVASMFSKSKILPDIYQNDIPSCFIAVHMAHRMGIDPFTFMQNSYVVKGKPSIEGKLAIAILNARGGYTHGVEFEYTGSGDTRSCKAYGILPNGKVHEAEVGMKMARDEGWTSNKKWSSMPDQMMAYRAASFLIRKYRPELLFGLQTYEEIEDVEGVKVLAPVGARRISKLNDVLEQG